MVQIINPLVDNELLEVMGHARGGQGMVTAFEILAKIFSHTGDYEVQAFPSFGVERTGAPIQGFLRISANTILNRSNIYQPNLIVVFDESLLGQVPVFDGLREGGIVLLNTSNRPDMFKDKAGIIYTIPATKISLEKKLGSKSLPIVNAAMIGALVRILGGDIEIAKAIIKQEVPTKPEANAEAAEIAYNSLTEYISEIPFHAPKVDAPVPKASVPATPFWTQPMSLNKTGSWRLSIPIYVTREAPCSFHCPAGTQVREFIELAAEKKFEEAYHSIYNTNPFPSICGKACPGYCEKNCNRGSFDGALNIRAIESFIGDQGSKIKIEPAPLKYAEKIAVLDCSADALTAALRLRQGGYPVTMFESGRKPGEFLRNQLLDIELPEEMIEKEINRIIEAGVEIICNKEFSVEDFNSGYSAVICSENYVLDPAFVIIEKEKIKYINDIPLFDYVDDYVLFSFAKTIGIGNETAKQVDAFLRNKKYAVPVAADDVVKSSEIRFQYYDAQPKNEKLSYTYEEILEGAGIAEIAEEAGRCMHCGSCFNCGNCYNFCPDALVYFDNKDRLRIDYEYCKGCGICYHECPSSAMKFDIIKKVKQ